MQLKPSVNRCPCIFLVLQGNITFSCSQHQLVACTFLSSISSFLSVPSAAAATGGFSVCFQFRTWNPDGLLLSVQLNLEPERLQLQLSNSQLYLTLHNSGHQKSEVSAGESYKLQIQKTCSRCSVWECVVHTFLKTLIE